MRKKNVLNARQEELMNWLWTYGKPLTSSEMAEELEPEGWNHVTLLKTVQSLTDAGYLEVVGLEKYAKTYARKLLPSLTKEEYYSTVLLNKGIDCDSLAEITAALLGVSRKKKDEKNAEVISRLEQIIAELRTSNTEDNE